MLYVFNNGKISLGKTGGQYDGEKMPGDLRDWKVLSSDSNYILKSTYGDLCKRSSTLYHTYGPASAAIDKHVTYAIGPGLIFRSQPDHNILGWTPERAKDWGKRFQSLVHYALSSLNFYEKQQTLFRQALVSGDSLLYFLREEAGLDLVEQGGDGINWQHADSDTTLGIKHDKYLRRQGFFTADGEYIPFKTDGVQNAIQFYDKKLARQLRGYPLVYKIINLAKNDDRHTDATVHRAVMESIILATSKSEGTDFNRQAQNLATASRKKNIDPNRSTSLFSRVKNAFQMGPGNVFQTKPGESFEFSELKTPVNNYKDFKESIFEYVGMATGTPPEVMMSKYTSSFTAHKGALNDFRKAYMQERQGFERKVMDIVVREVARELIQQGMIEAPGFFDSPLRQQAYLSGMYIGPVPHHINPLQEINAEIRAVEAGFQLRSDVAARYGNEWDNFIEERAAEEAEFARQSPDAQAAAVQNSLENEQEDNNA